MNVDSSRRSSRIVSAGRYRRPERLRPSPPDSAVSLVSAARQDPHLRIVPPFIGNPPSVIVGDPEKQAEPTDLSSVGL